MASILRLLGNGWAAGIHPEDRERCLSAYSNAFARAELALEYRLRRFDRNTDGILDQGVLPRFESNGTFCGYIGSCVDIADRKSYEVSLQELSGRLITAQEEERTGIARELHHDLSQRMARLLMRIERCQQGTA